MTDERYVYAMPLVGDTRLAVSRNVPKEAGSSHHPMGSEYGGDRRLLQYCRPLP
jgi:hypothetical protein